MAACISIYWEDTTLGTGQSRKGGLTLSSGVPGPFFVY